MADHNTPQAVAERIKEWIGTYGGENTATLLLYEAMNALNGAPAAAVADAQPMALVKSVKALLAGIDETELDSERGWWATSQGAEFGDIKLGQLLALLLSAMPGATPSENKPVAYVESMMLSMRGHTPMVRCLTYVPVDTLLYAAPQPSGNPGPLAAVERAVLNLDRFKETSAEGGGVYETSDGDFVRLSEVVAAIAASKEGASHG